MYDCTYTSYLYSLAHRQRIAHTTSAWVDVVAYVVYRVPGYWVEVKRTIHSHIGSMCAREKGKNADSAHMRHAADLHSKVFFSTPSSWGRAAHMYDEHEGKTYTSAQLHIDAKAAMNDQNKTGNKKKNTRENNDSNRICINSSLFLDMVDNCDYLPSFISNSFQLYLSHHLQL